MLHSRTTIVRRALVTLFAVLAPIAAQASVSRTGLKLRWVGAPPGVVRAGEPVRGTIEAVTASAGVLSDVRIAGAGWSVRTPDAPERIVMPSKGTRRFEFEAVPRDPSEPLVVSALLDGRRVSRTLRLDARTLERAQRPTPVAFLGGAPRSMGSAQKSAGGQTIRLKGRFVYVRNGADTLGADHLVVRVRDDDSPDPFDDTVWEGFTDENGNFDVVVDWDDCDVTGCDDPDLYVEFSAGGPEVDVQTADLLEITYDWSSEGSILEDFTGSTADFGTMMSGDASEHGAVFIYNNTIRAHRYAASHAMNTPLIDVQWPDDDTFYRQPFEEVHIGDDETWNEGTQSHEFGHHVQKHFSFSGPADYDNGYCDGDPDDPDDDTHCIYCPENHQDAIGEGWPNWFASYLNRKAPTRYGVTPLSMNDSRYTIELTERCQQAPRDSFPDARTENFVAALLRDIEDDTNEDADGDAVRDCAADEMSLGDAAIMTVFRDDDPNDVFSFITNFRLRYPEHDQDLWSTTRNVALQFGFPVPPPVITQQPPACIVVRMGETIVLQVRAPGRRLKYQWRKNGAPLFDDGVVAGSLTDRLFMSPAGDWMNGTFDCLVSTCNDTFSTLSTPCRVTVLAAPQAKGLVSWGTNGSGQVGDGTSVFIRPPTALAGIADMQQAMGGVQHTVALRANGTLLAWGTANNGELGNNQYSGTQLTPVPVHVLTDVMQIAAGDAHTLAVKRDGTLWAWGSNAFGQLGDGTFNARPVPVPSLASLGCVAQVACGSNFGMALQADGTVSMWGDNSEGQLGRGTVGGWFATPAPVVGLTDVEAIAASGLVAMALKRDGTVWMWGSNTEGWLGIGVDQTVTPRSALPLQTIGLPVIRKIAAGWRSGFAISNAGAAYSWGSNQYGLLGRADVFTTHSPTPGLIPGLTLPTRIVTGWGTWASALNSQGEVWVWGYNNQQVLGRMAPGGSEFMYSPLKVDGVKQVTVLGSGWSTLHAVGALDGVTDAPDATLPLSLALRATPNPAIGPTRLAFELPREARVELGVYDLAGRRVRVLRDGTMAPGRHEAAWDGRADGGHVSLAGVYFVRLSAGGAEVRERVVRVR